MSYDRRRRPHTSTFSTLPPSDLTTLRNWSSDGATVRSSVLGSRMTMSSKRRMRVPTSFGLVRSRSLRDRRALRLVADRLRAIDTGYQQPAAQSSALVDSARPAAIELGHDVGHPRPHARGLGGRHGQLLAQLDVIDRRQLADHHRHPPFETAFEIIAG